ncbi:MULTISPECIES: hypothetical protein [unclassified Streptomyces]|uniref:hypothetical protein n=1 Tax=unclassified Streptomyces TaxID=2593676 RepID=UPI00093E9518|nr:hypothetical protein [Streptomyces sp. CB02058]OKI97580.1 hypothetical protein AMK10_01750 [Streptomyces sp. CB02058]
MTDQDALLVKDVMKRAADDLGPLPDLVPEAVVRGRRRRARTRLALTTSAFGAVTLGVLGAAVLSGGGSGPGPASVTEVAAAQAPHRTPVHVEPSPGETMEGGLSGLPAGERQRLEDFQQRAAVALDEALPDTVGEIRPVDSTVARYQGGADGNVFTVDFTVRPVGGRAPEECRNVPQKRLTCVKAELAEGVEARLRRAAVNSMQTTSTSMAFEFGNSTVLISVSPDEGKGVSAPVTVQQLLDGVRASGLLDVVRYADEHPVLQKQVSVQGG